MTFGAVVTFATIAAISFAGTLLGQVWFLAELKRHDPVTWRAAASPAWLRPLSLPALRFIQAGRYQTLRSPRLRALGATLRLAQIVLALFMVGGIAFGLSALW